MLGLRNAQRGEQLVWEFKVVLCFDESCTPM